MKFNKNIGMILLAIYLILNGAIHFLNLSISGLPTIMAALAIAAGIFILLGK